MVEINPSWSLQSSQPCLFDEMVYDRTDTEMEGQGDRFIEDVDNSSKPRAASRGEKIRQRVAIPLQSRLKTFMTRLESSTDVSDLEMRSSTNLAKGSTAYERFHQDSASLSPQDMAFTDPSQHLPAKVFQRKTRFLRIQWGKWRVFVRHFVVFGLMVISICIPCVYVGYGIIVIQKPDKEPFQHDCYGTSNGWTCKPVYPF